MKQLPLEPGDELHCRHCRRWHSVVTWHSEGTPYKLRMLYWTCGEAKGPSQRGALRVSSLLICAGKAVVNLLHRLVEVPLSQRRILENGDRRFGIAELEMIRGPNHQHLGSCVHRG
jgi:hypothetical protein